MLFRSRQQRWRDALRVKSWMDSRVVALGERRGPIANSLHRLFDQLRQAAAEQAPDDEAAAQLTDAAVLRLVFG